ncbi:hypothetical protein ERX35_000960 [Macrococcus equipercicus]|uniref:Phage protein n=1 Tax=Macrococcus equipercicus TaxID=69967 RepID=A0ABQ6RB76_9STAP|nr:hypothetical protein [Macrococcus equipercicus]KAA1042482.1 hypothetical protein ERX35_000960 [Macrococcus equipercicus]
MTTNNRSERVAAEIERLNNVFKDIPEDKKHVVEGLIVQAARLRIMLDDAWQDIDENGDYEQFQQSPSVPAYDRERPIAKLFNARDKAYQTIMKQLADFLPNTNLETVIKPRKLL